MKITLVFCLSLFLVLLVAGRNLQAQSSDTGSLTGTVTDNTGAVLPGATVTVTAAAGATQTATSDEKGVWEIKDLAPGKYTLRIAAPGFATFESSPIVVAAQSVTVDSPMQPAEVKTEVNVQGQTVSQVETENAQLQGTITEQEVTTLGLNGRNFTQFATLAPGVSNQTGQDEALVGIKGSVKYSVNGGRVEYNTFDIDGGDVLNPLNAQTTTLVVYPSIDAIEQMQVLTSNYGAMYGRTASGTILATTKSGTQDFHGDLYFFARNNDLNSKGFFDETHGAPLYHKYDPGGTIGGPLYIPGVYNEKKDKTFFFFSEEYRHDREPTDFNQAVPSLAERNCMLATSPQPFCQFNASQGQIFGDFTDVCPPFATTIEFTRNASVGKSLGIPVAPDCPGIPLTLSSGGFPIFEPFAGNLVPINNNNFPNDTGNPNSALLPANILLNTGVIPAPNSTTGCNTSSFGNPSAGSCYDVAVSPLTTWHEELFRIDHNFNARFKAYIRFIHDSWNTDAPTPLYSFIENSFPTIQNGVKSPGLSVIAHFSQTLSPNFINDFAFSYVVDHIRLTDINGPGANFERPADLQTGYIFNNGFGGKIPGISIAGTNAAYGGTGFAIDPAYMPWTQSNPVFSPREDASYQHGKHFISFGFLLVVSQRNEINPPVGANNGDLQGLATFSNAISTGTTGNSFADFLEGTIASFQQDSAQERYHNNYTFGEPYVQDDWHVTPRLTLNLGFRASLFGTWHETRADAFNWVPSAFSQSLASQVFVSNLPFSSGQLQFVSSGTPVPLDPSNIDPHLTNGIVQCGKNGVPSSCMKGHVFNAAPRIGVAWDPFGSGKTSIRAGYGIFYEHGVGNEANTGSLEGSPANAPFGVLDITQNQPSSWSCIGNALAGCPAPGAYPINVTAIPTKAVWPYVQQWSLSIQRELPGNLLGTIAYVGSKGTHLTAELQLNQLVPVSAADNPFAVGQPLGISTCDTWDGTSFTIPNSGQLVTSSDPAYVNIEAACYSSHATRGGATIRFPDPNSLREFAPGLGEIFALENVANSNYNALQMTLRRTKGPISLGLSYSYSHSIDDSSDRSDATLINSFDLGQSRASSNFDERNLLNIDYIWDIPMARIMEKILYQIPDQETGQKRVQFDENKHANLFKGWQLSGITTFASGTPYSVISDGSINDVTSSDNAGVANGLGAGSYADIVKHPGQPIGNLGGFGPLLGNPNEFMAPQGLTFGDAGRNSLNNPHEINFDMSLIKNFRTSEKTSLQFRAETYNIFNHTNFRVYDPSRPGNPGNNIITCYGSDTLQAGDPECAGSSFLHPIDAHRPRTMQLAVKFLF